MASEPSGSGPDQPPTLTSDGEIQMAAAVRPKSPLKRSRDSMDDVDSEESAPQSTKRTKDDTYEDKLRTDAPNWEWQYHEMEKKWQATEEDRQTIIGNANGLHTQYTDLWEDWKKKVKEIDGLNDSLKKATEQWNNDIGHSEYGREAVRRLQQEIKSLEGRLVTETKELEDTIKSWKQTAAKKDRERLEMEGKLVASYDRSKKLQSEANQEDKRVKEQVKLETQKIRDAWMLDGLALRKGKEALEASLEKVKEREEEQRHDNWNYKSQIKGLHDEIAKLQLAHKKVVSDRDGILTMARKLEKTHNEMVEQRDKLQIDLDNPSKSHHALQKLFSDKEDDCRKLAKNVTELEGQLEDVQTHFQEMEVQKNGAENYAQKFADANNDLSTKLVNHEHTIQQLHAELMKRPTMEDAQNSQNTIQQLVNLNAELERRPTIEDAQNMHNRIIELQNRPAEGEAQGQLNAAQIKMHEMQNRIIELEKRPTLEKAQILQNLILVYEKRPTLEAVQDMQKRMVELEKRPTEDQVQALVTAAGNTAQALKSQDKNLDAQSTEAETQAKVAVYKKTIRKLKALISDLELRPTDEEAQAQLTAAKNTIRDQENAKVAVYKKTIRKLNALISDLELRPTDEEAQAQLTAANNIIRDQENAISELKLRPTQAEAEARVKVIEKEMQDLKNEHDNQLAEATIDSSAPRFIPMTQSEVDELDPSGFIPMNQFEVDQLDPSGFIPMNTTDIGELDLPPVNLENWLDFDQHQPMPIPTELVSPCTDQVDSTKLAIGEIITGQLESAKAVDESRKCNGDVDKRRESAEAELAVTRKNLDSSNTELATIRKDRDSTKAELAKTQKDLSNEQAEHRVSRDDLNKLQKEFDDLQDRYDEEQEEKSIDQQFAKQSTQDTRADHEELKGRCDDLKKQCTDLTKQLSAAKADVLTSRNAHGEVHRRFKGLEKEYTNLTQKLSTTEAELSAARNAHEQVQSQYNDRDEECRQQLTRQDIELSDAQSDLESMHEKVTELENKLSAAQANLSSSRNSVKKLQGRFNNVEKEHHKARDRYNGLEKDYQDLNIAMQHLDKECKNLQRNLVTREDELQELGSKYEKQGKDLTKANDRDKEHTHRATGREKHIRQQEGDLFDLRTELKNLEMKKANLEAAAKRMDKKYSAIIDRNTKLVKSHEELEKKRKLQDKGIQAAHRAIDAERMVSRMFAADKAVLEQEKLDICQAFSVLKEQFDNFRGENSHMKDDYEHLSEKGGDIVQKKPQNRIQTQEDEASQMQLHDRDSIASDEASQTRDGHALLDQLRSASPSMAQQGGQSDDYIGAILADNHYDSNEQGRVGPENQSEAIRPVNGHEPTNLGAVDTVDSAQGIPPVDDNELFGQHPTRDGTGAGTVASINHGESPDQASGEGGDNAQAIPTTNNNQFTAHQPANSEGQAGTTSPVPNNDPTNRASAPARPSRSRTAGILGLLLLIATLVFSIGLAVYFNACSNYDAIITRADDATRAMLLSERMGGGTGTIQPAWLGWFLDDVVVEMIPGLYG